MHLYFIGFVMWAVIVAAALRLVTIGFSRKALPRIQAALWIVMLIMACLVMFRPHEDLFGGQDQGSYVNSAYTYMREGALAFEDPLLSEVEPEVRTYFRYFGHGNRYQPSTMGVLKTDFETAYQKPYFMPAYAIAAGFAGRPFGPAGVLYVAPVFTILAALALSVLAFMLLGSRSAQFCVFVLYILNPVVCWHGRGARPELAASFLLFAGAAMLVSAMTRERAGNRLDVILGAVCLAMAPFFHVTAWMAVLPLGLVIGLAAACGNRRLLPAIAALVIGAALFVFQTVVATDCYRLQTIAAPLFQNPVLLVTLIVGLGLAVTGLCFVSDGKKPGLIAAEIWRKRGRQILLAGGIAVSVLTVLVCIISARGIDAGGLRTARVMQILRCTDVNPYVAVVTPAMAVLGLAGWCVFIIAGGPMRRERVLLAAAFLPGLILMGRMPISMYFLRRSLLYMVPAAALGTASILYLVERFRPRLHSSILLPAVAIAVAAGGLWGRTQLCMMTDYKGLASHLSAVAERVKRDDGILLCEYSRIAAPLYHVFGIPALPLDNEHITDYRPAERAWEAIMRSRPEAPAFFATPFDDVPLSQRFTFKPVMTQAYVGARLHEQQIGVPANTLAWKNRIHLYEMILREGPVEYTNFPVSIMLGAPGTGRWRFEQPSWKERRRMEGMPLDADETFVFSLSDVSAQRANEVLLFLLDREDANADGSPADITAPGMNVSSVRIGLGWNLVKLSRSGGGECRVEISPRREVLLTQIQTISSSGCAVNHDLPGVAERGVAAWPVRRHQARWGRQHSGILTPVPPEGGLLCVLTALPSELEDDGLLTIRGTGEKDVSLSKRIPHGRWEWHTWQLQPPDDTGLRAIEFNTDQSFDPGTAGFAEDLSLSVACVAVVR